jgi:myo-inositol 2-dehydrogenase/D-chiro-inositol 1-dehydrogenase
VHVMDLMLWFTGSRVTEVYAYAATMFYEGLAVDDTGMISVKFENGAFGVLDTSWSRPKSFPAWGDVTMEIIGTKEVISVDGFAQHNEFYSDEIGKGVWSYWGDSMDHDMVKSFVESLIHGRTVPISGEDGLRSAEDGACRLRIRKTRATGPTLKRKQRHFLQYTYETSDLKTNTKKLDNREGVRLI